MKIYNVLLRKGNVIIEVIGTSINKYAAEEFIREDERFNEFHKDVCQYSKFEQPEFITIEESEIICLKH